MASTDAAAAGNARQENSNGIHGERRRGPGKGQAGRGGRGAGSGRGEGGAGRVPVHSEEATKSSCVEEDDGNLEPPLPVDEPDAEENNALLSAIRAEMDQIEKRVAEINDEVQQAKEIREVQEVAVKDFKAEIGPIRAQIAQVSREKDDIMERMKKLNDQIKNQDNAAAKLRKELRFKSEEDIDSAIAELNHRLEHSSMDLKAEKELVRDLQKLNGDKERIREYNAQVEDVKAKRYVHEDLYLQRQAKGAELKQLYDQDKAIQAKIDAVRSGEGVANGFNANAKITALLDEKARLVEKLKERRGAMQEINTAFRLKIGEHRDYKRAKMAYERKLERKERQRRQAEAAARADRIKEERKQRDNERKEARRREEQRMIAVAEGCQLYIGGLAIRCDEEAIRAHFARFGTISDVNVIRDPETKLSRGFGFVTFAEEARAKEAIKECNGKETKGLCPQHGRIQVKIAEKSKAQQEFEAKRMAARAPKPNAARAVGEGDGTAAINGATGAGLALEGEADDAVVNGDSAEAGQVEDDTAVETTGLAAVLDDLGCDDEEDGADELGKPSVNGFASAAAAGSLDSADHEDGYQPGPSTALAGGEGQAE